MWEDTGTKMSPTLLQQQNRDLNYAMKRNSVSITHTKGLLNGPGQNNCFLNSAVQVLWHLDIFRRSFRELTGHACMADSCIFCALKELFAQFQYSHESALPPDALRRALAETFFNQQRFQLGFMDDAAECFENILLRIHSHIANMESEDMCNAPHCISHQKFAMTLVEQSVCHACGATSEPLSFTQMVHYVSASALCAQAKQAWDEGATVFPEFGQLLRKAGGMGDMRHCPSACGAKIQICRSLMNRPEIVSVGIVWDSERPTLDHIMNVFSTIRTTIKLQDMFHSVVDSRWASSSVHQLVGVVTYYGKHYSTFFFHTKLRVWIYFDDATVREIGPRWDQVVEKCHRGHFQPLLLLYAHPHGTPISLESAPQVITYINGHKRTSGSNKADIGRDSYDMEASRTKPNLMNPVHRRAVTPNPESNYDTSKEIQPRRAITPNPDPHVHANGGKSSSLPNTLQHTSGKESKDYDSNHLSTQDITKECSPVGNGIYGHLNYSHENSRSTVADTKGNWRSINEDQNQSKNHTLQAEDLHVMNRRGSNEPDNVFKFPPPKSLLEEMKLSLNPETERLIRDVDGIYISRKAVESVLNYQKLQRQRSLGGSSGYNSSTIGNRNSNSSIESFETGLRNRNQINNYPTEMKTEGVDTTNLPRRRDSGNWSGDRNSASSSSSVSLDNPYMHVVANKRPFAMPTNRNPPMKPSDFSGNPMYDPGYDSYSLSSNDSFPLSPIAKHSQQLAQIPENPIKGGEIRMHSSTNSIDDCERLCIEADHFLEKSKEMEDTGDFLGAISLCNGAAAKARAAMDAPYTNPQSITFARMKHNTCVMRARSLHRRYLMRQESLNSQGSTTSTETDNSDSNKSENIMEGRHSRQSSADRSRRGEGSHSRQSSRDNTSHSRQSSRDSTHKKIANIEIYATLPKKNSKKKLDKLDKIKTGSVRAKDEHIFLQTHEKYKELVNFAEEKRVMKLCEVGKDEKIKAKRKEDRKQKGDTDFSDYASEWELTRKPNLHHTYSGPACLRDLTSSQSYTDLSKVKPDPPKPINPGKKQHKIRRKLLMGGLIRRKNRSMPDLREGQDGNEKSESTAFDDLQKGPFIEGNLTGYLSDAHLDSVQHRFPEQSLQKQVLYGSQRQLHSSHGKIPPQPPVRTTSQLSSRPQINSAAQKASFHPLLVDHNGTFPPGKQTPNYHPIKPHKSNSFHHVLPSKTHSTQQIVVQAEVHHERTPSDNIRPVSHKHSQDSNFGVSVDQKPLSPKPVMMNYEKPPSVVRNANLVSENKSSNDPSANGHSSLPADSSVKSADTDEDLPKGGGLLAELQAKRKQILKPKTPLETSKITDNQKSAISPTVPSASNSSSTTNSSCGWLQELQAKQMMMLQQRKTSQDGKQQSTVSVNKPTAPTEVNPIHVKQYNVVPNLKTNLLNNNPPTTGKINLEETEVDARPKSVKDLASKFEKIVSPVLPKKNSDSANPRDNIASNHHTNSLPSPTFIQNSSLYSLPNPQHDATSKKTTCVPSKFSTNNRGNEAYFKMNNGHVNNENASDHVSGNSDDLSNSLTRSSGSFSNSSENRLQHSALHNSEYRQNTFHSTSQTVSFSNSHNPMESSTVWQQKEQQVQQAVPPISYGKSHQDVAEISADSVDFGLRNGVVNNSKSYQLHNHYYPQTPADPNHLNRPRDCVDGVNVIPNGTNSMRLTQRTSDNQMKADIPHYNTKSIDHSTAEQYKNAIRQMNIRADHRIDSVGTQNIESNGNKNMASAHSDNHKPLDTDSLVQNSAATCSKKRKTGKKSVTFSDQIALVASADDGSEDYIPNPLLERVYKTVALQQRQPKPVIQNSLHKHSTVQPPVAHPHIPPPVCCDPPIPHGLTKLNCSPNKVPCHLCRKKSVLPPTVYCPDCDFYMSRFKPK